MTKNDVILNHYRNLIENYLFDEYDILGFLIFIREQIREQIDKTKYHPILEFCDLIAHRDRDRGEIRDSIQNAINNSYQRNERGKVEGYHGIDWELWKNEWKIIGDKFNINFEKDNDKLLKEITICIFSLAQDTIYKNNEKNIIGKVSVFIGNNKDIALVTMENTSSPVIVFMICGQFKNIDNEYEGFIEYPLETKREEKSLCLYCENKKILEIN